MRAFKNLIETPNWDPSTLEKNTMVLKISPRLQRDSGFQLWKGSKICTLIFLSPLSPFRLPTALLFKSRESQLIPEAGQENYTRTAKLFILKLPKSLGN